MQTRLLIFAFLFMSSVTVQASHIRGGQIRVISINGLTVRIQLQVLTNTMSDIKFGEGTIDLGDGTKFTTPTQENMIVSGLDDVGIVNFYMDYVYSSPGFYKITYRETNLTAEILNIFNSVETPFFIESGINLNSEVGPTISPDFPTIPIFTAPLRSTYSFSTTALDGPAGDFFYRYSLVTEPANVLDFEIPGDLKVNEKNGMVTWNTKFKDQYTQGLFWIQVKIEQYSKTGFFLGYVIRALQISVEDAAARIGITSPISDSNNRVDVTDGQKKTIRFILSSDRSNASFKIYYDQGLANNIVFTQYDSILSGGNATVGKLEIETTTDVVSDFPYPIVLRGISGNYRADFTILYMTRNIALPEPPVVTGLPEEEKLSIYPNPFRSEVYVSGSTATEATFINTFGQVVMKSPFQQGRPVNTAYLPRGLYLLRVGNEIRKVICD